MTASPVASGRHGAGVVPNANEGSMGHLPARPDRFPVYGELRLTAANVVGHVRIL
jgi:hypothetical protein